MDNSMNTVNCKSAKLEQIQNLSKDIQTKYGNVDLIDGNKREQISDKLPECSTSSVVEYSDEVNLHDNQLKTRMLNTEMIVECETPCDVDSSIPQINEILQNESNKDQIIIELENRNNDFVEKIKMIKEENDQLKMENEAIKSFVNEKFRFENSYSNMIIEMLPNASEKQFESFEFCFPNISQMRTIWGKESSNFQSNDGKYNMILELWSRGCSYDHRDSHICVAFKINDSPSNCKVTLKIGSQSSTNQHEIIVEKYLNFDKVSPEKILPQFHLSKQDLKKIEAMQSDCLLIRCDAYIE